MNACYENYFPFELNNGLTWSENEALIETTRQRRSAITCIATGMIGVLGGIFLLLAALQVLPHGVNAISELGVGGKVTGGAILGLGLLTAFYGLVRYCATCKATPPEPTPSEPIQYSPEEARVHFNGLLSIYYSTVECTSGCGKRVQGFIDNDWNKLNEFAQAYPEFRSEVPKKAIQYDDGHRGLSGAMNAYAGAISPHYRALEPRIAPFSYDS